MIAQPLDGIMLYIVLFILFIIYCLQGPIAIAVNANGLQQYKQGVACPLADICDPTMPNHAMLLVGWGVDDGQEYWKVSHAAQRCECVHERAPARPRASVRLGVGGAALYIARFIGVRACGVTPTAGSGRAARHAKQQPRSQVDPTNHSAPNVACCDTTPFFFR
jgi:hypothetical protein